MAQLPFVVIAAALASWAASAAGEGQNIMPDVTLGIADSGRTIELAVGNQLLLQLPESPSTGHAWALQPIGSPVVELTKETFDPSQTLQPGAAGSHLYFFRSREPGEVRLRLELRQPWQPGTVAQSFEIAVRVVTGRP